MSDIAVPVENGPLVDEEVDTLLEALRKLRWHYHVKYKKLATEITAANKLEAVQRAPKTPEEQLVYDEFTESYIWNVNVRRTRPSRKFQEAVYNFARTREYDLAVRDLLLSEYQLSVALEMDLNRKKLEQDVDKIKGDYICYTKRRDGFSGSVISLYGLDSDKSWPEFSMWYPKLLVQGYYYMYEGTIYMIGHIVDSAMPRLMTFWREKPPVPPEGHYVGTIALSNTAEHSLMSWAYLARVGRSEVAEMRAAKWAGLGFCSTEDLESRHPEIAKYFEGKPVIGEPRIVD